MKGLGENLSDMPAREGVHAPNKLGGAVYSKNIPGPGEDPRGRGSFEGLLPEQNEDEGSTFGHR